MVNPKINISYYTWLYAVIHLSLGRNKENNIIMNDIASTILTQHRLSKVLKIFEDKGVESFLLKLKQLHKLMVVEP